MAADFTSPPDPIGFNHAVWEIVRQVPPGSVVTYGQVAALIPSPAGLSEKDYAAFGARWVGGAMARCPEGVPWQRVINAQGKISIRKGSNAHLLQKELLVGEGVEFDDRERVDLKRYGWSGPG